MREGEKELPEEGVAGVTGVQELQNAETKKGGLGR